MENNWEIIGKQMKTINWAPLGQQAENNWKTVGTTGKTLGTNRKTIVHNFENYWKLIGNSWVNNWRTTGHQNTSGPQLGTNWKQLGNN